MLYLNVPFKDKDEVKYLGARWDSQKKKWYIEYREDYFSVTHDMIVDHKE